MKQLDTIGRVSRLLNTLQEATHPRVELLSLQALMCIAKHRQTTMSYIAETLEVSSSAASRMIQRMTDEGDRNYAGYGLVERIYDPMDRRSKQVQLTKKGKHLIQELEQALASQ